MFDQFPSWFVSLLDEKVITNENDNEKGFVLNVVTKFLVDGKLIVELDKVDTVMFFEREIIKLTNMSLS